MILIISCNNIYIYTLDGLQLKQAMCNQNIIYYLIRDMKWFSAASFLKSSFVVWNSQISFISPHSTITLSLSLSLSLIDYRIYSAEREHFYGCNIYILASQMLFEQFKWDFPETAQIHFQCHFTGRKVRHLYLFWDWRLLSSRPSATKWQVGTFNYMPSWYYFISQLPYRSCPSVT